MYDLIAIDGNSLLFRAFYALPDMTSRDGTPTGALHGFLMMLFRLMEEKPAHMVVAFDVHEPTFRHKAYDAYKAGRRETPPELIAQFPLLKNILAQMGVCVVECPGFEADDILGTYARIAEREGKKTLLVTGDRDALQLITEATTVRLTKKGLTEIAEMTPTALMEAYGLVPDRMRDLKGLMGDNSDNIPGIPGVGEKTALKLLGEYGSLDGVLENADKIKGKLGEKVRDNMESARLSYWLGTINTEAPVPYPLCDTGFSIDTVRGAEQELMRLELRAALEKLPRGNRKDSAPAVEKTIQNVVPIKTEEELLAAVKRGKGMMSLSLLHNGSIGFSFDGETVFEVSAGETLFDVPLADETVFAALKPFLEDRSVEKHCYDVKKLYHVCAKRGICVNNIVFDAMLVDYLLDANRPCDSMDALAGRYLSEKRLNAGHLIMLRPVMETALEENGMIDLYREMELPLAEVLFRMERTGVLVDGEMLQKLQVSFDSRAAELSSEIYELAGERFNILSTKQLGTILFDKLNLKPLKKTKSGYSTDADTLEKLQDDHPIIPKVQEYRFLTKLKSTFLDGLLTARSPEDGRVHTQFQQCVTATGRLSSAEPNLQNIPVRTELGREIRHAFIAGPGKLLVGADYSQIELRLLAHLSGDPGMIRAFTSGVDVHRHTASEVFGVPLDQVTKEQRSAAKAVNFGIVYGISDFGLARNLGIPVKEAASYIAAYFARYPGVKAYMERAVEEGKRHGYARTLYGRRRPLPEIASSNYNTRSFGERVAMNMPVQGTAADIIKLAMLRADKAVRESGIHARMLLQVHDELIFEVEEAEASKVAELVRNSMEGAAELSVPLTVEVNVAPDWGDTK